MATANIPDGWKDAELIDYQTDFPGCTQSQISALLFAQKFVLNQLAMHEATGIVFQGPVGVGKTHLAVGILKDLIRSRRLRGIFYSSRHLINTVRSTFEREDLDEWAVMRPVLESDILVLDDLGAGKLTEYVQEQIAYILTERYNRKLTTIITTNYPVRAPHLDSEREQVEKKKLPRTLGDCIGDRAFSRLHEMCFVCNIFGDDYRNIQKRGKVEKFKEKV